jgi:C1A family cysteine protease
MRECLADGFPFVFGLTIYSSFSRSTRTGDIPIPTAQESATGGHAMLAVGYDDGARSFLVRNSWGKRWGRGGYGRIPYEYLLGDGLASNIWTIRAVEMDI